MKPLPAGISAFVMVVAFWVLPSLAQSPKPTATTSPSTVPSIALDLDKAVEVPIPPLKDLEPVDFKTTDKRSGWVVQIPGGRPIATPAYADGLIFVGGGYGSHEFYAFDADSGKVMWQSKTADDGPTAAVVEDGLVAYNTESCTVIVCEAKTGKVVWQEWLGDPLMGQPAIDKGRLYIAYPGGHPHGPVIGDKQPDTKPSATTEPQTAVGHRLLCADLKTGKHLWEQDITGDVISAPVVEGDKVYLTCLDGTCFCIKTADGAVVWKKEKSGTSAPLVKDGQVVVAQRGESSQQIIEGLQRFDSDGKAKDKTLLAQGNAEYLKAGNNGAVAINGVQQQALDSSVGFAGAPVGGGLFAAAANVNVGTVVGAWSYQGSRPASNAGMDMNCQGASFNCISAADGKPSWRVEAKGRDVSADIQLFAPPALGQKYLYTVSAAGHVICLAQADGALQFAYHINLPMAFQPALARGNIYIGATNGKLICLKTGENDADGWYEWGGNARHNK